MIELTKYDTYKPPSLRGGRRFLATVCLRGRIRYLVETVGVLVGAAVLFLPPPPLPLCPTSMSVYGGDPHLILGSINFGLFGSTVVRAFGVTARDDVPASPSTVNSGRAGPATREDPSVEGVVRELVPLLVTVAALPMTLLLTRYCEVHIGTASPRNRGELLRSLRR